MVQSSRLKKLARDHMAAHPGVKYQQALDAVTATETESAPVTSAASIGDIPDFFEALGITDISTHDFQATWAANHHTDEIRIPVALLRDGDELLPELSYLNFCEENRGGNGPHGVIVGRTGSGKSRFLRTVVLALMSKYGPDTIGFLLADYKGGETFRGMDPGGVPHVLANISGLDGDQEMVDRLGLVIEGEIVRRTEFITGEKGCKDIFEYREQQRQHSGELGWPPLPNLFVVIEEFNGPRPRQLGIHELLTRVSRVGRSLGMHLVLCSQHTDPSVLGDLLQHLTFRYSLAVGSAHQSITMIGTDAAAKSSGGTLPGKIWRKFSRDEAPVEIRALDVSASVPGSNVTMADALLDRLSREPASDVRRLWTNPLRDPVTLLELGLQRLNDGLGIQIGHLDDPMHHRTLPWTIDLGSNTPHWLISGDPGSGCTTALQTLVLAACAQHTPQNVSFILLDSSSGQLRAVAESANVIAYAHSVNADSVKAALDEIDRLMKLRHDAVTWPHNAGIDAYLAGKNTDTAPGDPYGHVIVAVDGLASFAGFSAGGDSAIHRIASLGRELGVHLVATDQTRAQEIYPGLESNFSGRIQLPCEHYHRAHGPNYLRARYESEIPRNQPGRSIDPATGLQARVALPVAGSIEPDGKDRGTPVYLSVDRTSAVQELSRSLSSGIDPVEKPTPERLAELADAARRSELQSVRNEIDNLIGRDPVKDQLRRILASAQVSAERTRRGLGSIGAVERTFVITGHPGTGKSHTADLLARALYTCGLTRSSKVVVTDWTQLVDVSPGDTADKARAVLEEASGATLIIDGVQQWHAAEISDVLVEKLDDGDGDIALILTGYPSDVTHLFETNRRLDSLFGARIDLARPTAAELWQHLQRFAVRAGLLLAAGSEETFYTEVEHLFEQSDNDHSPLDVLCNIRFASTVVEHATRRSIARLADTDLSKVTDAQLTELTAEDIAVAVRGIDARIRTVPKGYTGY